MAFIAVVVSAPGMDRLTPITSRTVGIGGQCGINPVIKGVADFFSKNLDSLHKGSTNIKWYCPYVNPENVIFYKY